MVMGPSSPTMFFPGLPGAGFDFDGSSESVFGLLDFDFDFEESSDSVFDFDVEEVSSEWSPVGFLPEGLGTFVKVPSSETT
ncbi:hypothetical protein NN4_12520 [Nocardia ninae NBRC 108245]|uniref:Uncharacterized protein n=1 Tax=Nocardia ninae NBRC 108245 TaxID=1210091 RepID=A0A511M7V8_9NOCA|nr:hypothetical protein NN4_12520 [Nocardia ninae NBRC 108245]